MSNELYVVMAYRDGSTYELQAVLMKGTAGVPNAPITLSKAEAERMVKLLSGALESTNWYISPAPAP